MGYRPRRPRGGAGYKKPKTQRRPRLRGTLKNNGAITTARRRRKMNRVTKNGDNSSASFTVIGNRWKSINKAMYKNILGRQMVSKHQWASATSGTGAQDCSEFRYLEKTDLDNMVTVANSGVTSAQSFKIFIGNISAKYYFKNQSNAVGKLMIYDVVYKKHTPTTSLDSGRELWTKGFTDLGTGAITRVGATPAQSSEFRSYCRIVKMTAVDLEPGQQHTHVINRSINRLYDSAFWQNNVGEAVASITGSCMFVWHGSLIHESTAPGTVTFSDMRLDVVGSLEYGFGYITKNTPTYTIQATMAQTIMDPDFMGETGDADINNVNA